MLNSLKSSPARAGHYFAITALALATVALPRAGTGRRLGPLDFILDTYVRGGEVYYRALKSDRGRLDGYVNQLATSTRTSCRGTSRSRSG